MKRLIVAILVGAAGYGVMPSGPWYRQIFAAALIVISNDIHREREWFS